jgi:hypothetical protein|nr:MAG TPA: hypothetical protein [Caudoviricetes sp.]
MDAVKFIEERNRMCGTMSEVWGVDAEQIVKNTEKWAAAHPRKTRQSVFLEQWPDAKLDEESIVAICPAVLSKAYRMYSGEKCPTTITPKICADCRREFWSQEVE